MNIRLSWHLTVIATIAALVIATSARAVSLSAAPAPGQLYLVISNSAAAIQLTAYNTVPGVSYQIQTNTDVTNPNSWGVWVNVLATNTVTPLSSLGSEFQEIFFRAVVLPAAAPDVSPDTRQSLYLGRLDISAGTNGNSRSAAVSQFIVNNSSNQVLAGWGQMLDPDGDCNFFLGKDGVVISVPGNPHDLAADINRTNAPRVIQEVDGDFTIQVRTDGRFEPGEISTQAGRRAYNGAAIIATLDPKNVVTLARAVFQVPGRQPAYYANFEMRSGGKLTRIGFTGDCGLPAKGPVFLRLQRRGSEIYGAISLDGAEWRSLGKKSLTSDWPAKLWTGITAINTSEAEFDPRFSELQITK